MTDFLIFAAALCLTWLYYKAKAVFWSGTLVYALFFVLFCHHYFAVWSKEIGAYFFAGMTQALERAAAIDTPRYYITVNSQFQGAKTVSEIITLFKHQVDATYFQGAPFPPTAPRLSAVTVAGNKYGLAYAERYNYIDPTHAAINPAEKAVYIVRDGELARFNPANFTIEPYGNYALVIVKSLVE